MSYDASDPRQVKERIKLLKVTERARDDFIRKVMETREGRAWFYGLLEKTHVWKSSFALDALAMAFSEGERNIGLFVLADVMQAAPAVYPEMVREGEELNMLEKVIQTGAEDGGSDYDTDDTA